MTACRECKAQISDQATQCPHCGAPVPKRTSIAKIIAMVAVVVIVARCVSSGMPDAPPSAPALSDAECIKDLACWSKRHAFKAESACKRAIEARLRFAHEWTDGMTAPAFPRIGWKDPGAGVYTLFGDQLRVQNAFGAMQRADYACVYNPAQQQVVEALIEPR